MNGNRVELSLSAPSPSNEQIVFLVRVNSGCPNAIGARDLRQSGAKGSGGGIAPGHLIERKPILHLKQLLVDMSRPITVHFNS